MYVVDRGDFVRPDALAGTVLEVIDGRKRRGWHPTLYFLVDVDRPWYGRGHKHIIRLDEITRLR